MNTTITAYLTMGNNTAGRMINWKVKICSCMYVPQTWHKVRFVSDTFTRSLRKLQITSFHNEASTRIPVKYKLDSWLHVTTHHLTPWMRKYFPQNSRINRGSKIQSFSENDEYKYEPLDMDTNEEVLAQFLLETDHPSGTSLGKEQ